MAGKQITLDEMIDSVLITEMIEQENKDLKEAGWTIEEVRALANFILDNQKQ